MDEDSFSRFASPSLALASFRVALMARVVREHRQYKDIRKVYHRRAVNLEKWEAGKVVWRN